MKLTEKISLETVGDKKVRIKLIEPENNQEAVLTHYLHSLKNKKISNFFKDDAINFTKEILENKYPENLITNKVAEEALQMGLFEMLEVPFPPVKNPKFTFIDLFAVIGGFCLAMQNLGVTLEGRAFRYNLFARSSQKGFPLQSLTQKVV